MISKDTSFIKI